MTDRFEMFHVVPEAFIMLLLDSLMCFGCRRALVYALEVIDERDT
jgi:hypothetical protein